MKKKTMMTGLVVLLLIVIGVGYFWWQNKTELDTKPFVAYFDKEIYPGLKKANVELETSFIKSVFNKQYLAISKEQVSIMHQLSLKASKKDFHDKNMNHIQQMLLDYLNAKNSFYQKRVWFYQNILTFDKEGEQKAQTEMHALNQNAQKIYDELNQECNGKLPVVWVKE